MNNKDNKYSEALKKLRKGIYELVEEYGLKNNLSENEIIDLFNYIIYREKTKIVSNISIERLKAERISNGIIKYLSENVDNFDLMELMVKCESAKIPDYDKILNPTPNNFKIADNETITKIIRLYDENFTIDKLQFRYGGLSIADKVNAALDKIN